MLKLPSLVRKVAKIVLLVLISLYVFTLVLSLGLRASREKYGPRELATEHGVFFDFRGSQVYYELYPALSDTAEPPLIFLHGFGANAASWRQQIDYFSSNRDLILVDMLGFGLSQELAPATKLGSDAQAEMVVALLEELAIRKAFIAGNSMGGGVAMRVALLKADMVAGLILVGSTDLSATAGLPDVLQFLNSPLFLEIPVNLAATEQTFQSILSSAFGVSEPTATHTAAYFRSYQVQGSAHNLIRHSFASSRDLNAELGNITQPTLVIYGKQDTWIPKATQSRLLAGLPNLEHVTLENIGHVPQEENPTLFNQLIGDWLKRQK